MNKEERSYPPPNNIRIYGSEDIVKEASKAADVFKQVYLTSLAHIHPEDALDIAADATRNYLELIGAVRPYTETESMVVKVSNVKELAKAVAEATKPPPQSGANLKVKNPGVR